MRSAHQRFQRKLRPLITEGYLDEKMRNDARAVRDWMLQPPQFIKRKFIKKVAVKQTKTSTDSPEKKKRKNSHVAKESTSTLKTPLPEFQDANVTALNYDGDGSSDFKEELMALLKKHGLINSLKQPQMTATDLNSSPLHASRLFHETTAASAPNAASTPTPSIPATNIPEPRQKILVTPTDEKEFPLLSTMAPELLQRGTECVGGMDMNQIRSETFAP